MYKSLKDTNYQNSLKKKNNWMAKKLIKKLKFIVKNFPKIKVLAQMVLLVGYGNTRM